MVAVSCEHHVLCLAFYTSITPTMRKIACFLQHLTLCRLLPASSSLHLKRFSFSMPPALRTSEKKPDEVRFCLRHRGPMRLTRPHNYFGNEPSEVVRAAT